MVLFFDANIDNKIIPIGSKSIINHNTIFNETSDDVHISLYPNNSNDYDFDNYDNNISFGASNLKKYYEGYIGNKNNKILRFNDYSNIINADYIPDINNSLGNNLKQFKSLSISSNIYLNDTLLITNNSNLYIFNDLFINNLNILNTIFTDFTISSNLLSSNLYTNILYTSNIYNNTSITTSNIILNNLLSFNNSIINIINTNDFTTKIINSSNIFVFNSLISSNISSSNLITSYIISSNLSNLYNLTTNSINITSNSFLGNIIIDSDILPYLNDTYSIGNNNNKYSNIFLNNAIISDYNTLNTSYSNIIINNNFVANNAFCFNITADNISSFNINTKGTNVFNNILNDNIYSDIIITSNLNSLDKLISKYITTDFIITNKIFASNINILGLLYSKSIETNSIISSNIFSSNLDTSNLTSLNLNINNTSFINTLLSYNDILLKNNNYNLGISNITWNSLYISSNIFIDNSIISSVPSNISLFNDIYIDDLDTSNINLNTIFIDNIYNSNASILSSNIITTIINTNTISSSNIINYNNINTSTIDAKYINANNILSSNLNIIYSLYGNLLKTSIIDTDTIISSNITNYNTLITSNIYTSNSYIHNIILPDNIIPSECNYYNLGSINKKWKEAYLNGNTVYLGDYIISLNNSNDVDFINNNLYQSVILNGINFINNSNNLYANININNGLISFISSNTSGMSLSYNYLKNLPSYENSNFILNNIIASNSLFYNKVSINPINPINPLNNNQDTLIINGTTISKYFIGSYIGNMINVSNILSTNLINKLQTTNGGIILPDMSFNNNSLNVNKITSYKTQSSFIGNGINISNIVASNIINNLNVYNSGTGCNNIIKNFIIIGNNSNNIIISSNFTFNNDSLNINGLLNVDKVIVKNLIITSNIFYGNASNVSNIISSNINGIISSDNGAAYYNIFSNLNWNNSLNINDNLFTTKNISSFFIGNGANISNIISSNISYININQGGINSNYYTFGTSYLNWTNNKLVINSNVSSTNIISYFIGNALNISNINANNITNIVKSSNGGFSNNIYNINELLYYGTSSTLTSSKLYFNNNKLFISGSLNSINTISSKLISSGQNLSNINANNITDIVYTKNGGTFNNSFQLNNILFVDSNIVHSNFINTSSNLSLINNKLYINGSLSVKSIYSSTFYGNALNISNIISSNFINYITPIKGGTGYNYIDYGNILIGNNTEPLSFNNNLNFSNNILYSKQIYSTYYNHNKAFSYKISGNFIGSAENISNISSLNIKDVVDISNGGTGSFNLNSKFLPYNSNIYWYNNKLIIDSNLYSDIYNSYYKGDATNISNIFSSNLINKLTSYNGSLNNYLTSYPISWDNSNNLLSIKKGSLYSELTYSYYYGNAINISNIVASNIINNINNSNGSIGNLFFNNNINFTQNNSSVSININSVLSKNIYNNIYYGNANNISNINNIINSISVSAGGFNSNNIIKNYIIYGANNNISTSSKLYWTNDYLYINNLKTNNVYSKYYGNSANISNINANSFYGNINNFNGSISTNYINYYSNMIWNNNKLIINGSLYGAKLYLSELLGNGINISNINASNIISSLSIFNGGFYNNSNINWSNNKLIINNIYANAIFSKYLGNAANISNIISSNLISTILNSNGGLTNAYYQSANSILTDYGYINNLLWSNNTLIVNNSILTKKIIAYHYGDATNISNISSSGIYNLDIINGGINSNIGDGVNLGNIIIGNDDTTIISSNLYWNFNNDTLNTYNLLINNIYGKKYNGYANDLSNIYASNIIDKLLIVNGGLGNIKNPLPYSYIIIGNDYSNVITSSNLTFNSNLYSMNLSLYKLYNNYINSSKIYSSIIQAKFLGNGIDTSNLNASNIISPIILYNNGGTNTSNFIYGNLLYYNYLYWNNNILTINSNLISKNINSYFNGDGINISNIISSNIINALNINNGGTGCNILTSYNLLIGNGNNSIIATDNLIFSNNNLIINGLMNASNYYGIFTGSRFNGVNNTKLMNYNLIDNNSIDNGFLTSNIKYNQYGKLYFGYNNSTDVSSNMYWSPNNSLTINGNINISNLNNFINSKYYSSNITDKLNVYNGGIGLNYIENTYILYGNINTISFSSNLVWDYNKLSTTNIYSTYVIGNLYGEAYNISNINATKLYGYITLDNGGTSNTFFKYGNLLLGNHSNHIISTSKLNWNNIINKFTILGDIVIPPDCNIYSKYSGNGNSVYNIILSNNNLIDNLGAFNGGTGRSFIMSNQILVANYSYPLITSSKFLWDDNSNILNVNGGISSKNIYTNIIYNLYSSNIKGVLDIYRGGTGNSNIFVNNIIVGNNSNALIQTNNFKWINNTLLINGNIYSKNNSGLFIGDGSLLSNLLTSNLYSNLKVINGGLGYNIFNKNNILIGNNKNNVYDTSLLSFNSNLYAFNLYNETLIANNIYYGDALNISNLNIDNFYGILSLSSGGTSFNYLPYGQLLSGNGNDIYYNSNIIWSNITNTLFADEIETIVSIGSFNGDGLNIKNINHSNILSTTSVINGGINCNLVNYGYIIVGNDENTISSRNLYWNNSNNILNITGDISANNVHINNYTYTNSLQGKIIGDVLNVSNIQSSNFIHHTAVINGGLGYNFINKGKLFVGNNYDKLITTSNLIWDDISSSLIVDKYDNGYVNADTYYTPSLYGDGLNISNYIFYSSNMVPSDMIAVLNGCMGSNFHNYKQLIFGDDLHPFTSSCNLFIDSIYDSILNIKGILKANNVYASGGVAGLSYQGKFYGDGINLSNIYSSNLSDAVPVINYGTGHSNIIPKGQLLVGNNTNAIITTSNLLFDIDNNIFIVNNIINTTTLSLENDIITSNSICSNLLTVTNESFYNYLYGNKIFAATLYGDGTNISNIAVNNISNLDLSIFNGGLGSNSLPLYNILIGNNENSVITTSNLLWINNLLINGNLSTTDINNINSIAPSINASFLHGDGYNISNLFVSSIIDKLPVLFGGTGCNLLPYYNLLVGNNSNPVLTTSNLLWDDNTGYLYINGKYSSITVSAASLSSSNLLTSNNLIIYGNSYYNYMSTNTIQSKFIGNGSALTNINVKNMSAISLPSYYGGTGSNYLDKGLIIIGNNNDPLFTTSNLAWDNQNLYINGNIYLKNYYTYTNALSSIYTYKNYAASYYGDGFHISNLGVNNIAGVIAVRFGGTGKSNISYGNVLVGNNSNTIIDTSNFNWDDNNYTLNVNNFLNTITISSAFINTSNTTINNNLRSDKAYYNSLYSKNIYGKYTGDGLLLSNINVKNINRLTLDVINGGFGSNYLDTGALIIGNDTKSVIISSNLNWNKNNLNINGTIYTNDIDASYITTDTLETSLYIGDGIELSNININNVNNILLNINNGGTGHSYIDNGYVLVGNNNNPLIITSNFMWNDDELYLNVSKIISKTISVSTDIDTSNLIASNIVNNIGFNKFNKLHSFNIASSNIYGDGGGISNLNITKFKGQLSYLYGGTSSNSLLNGAILYDNSYTSPNLLWHSNSLYINGNINANKLIVNSNLYSKTFNNSYLYGDGANISNIFTNNIIGTFPISASGTGCNILEYGYILIGNNNKPIILSSNLWWDDENSALNINGRIITTKSLSASDFITSNFTSTNFNAVSTINTNNFSNLYTKKTQGLFYGDAFNISNIYINNINSTLFLENGGFSCNSIDKNYIIIGNDDKGIIISSNLYWDKDLLNINGELFINNIYSSSISSKNNYASYISGDGYNLSNLYTTNFNGVFPVSCSGTGCNFINYGSLLIGNNSNSIITTSNLIWDDNTTTFYINGSLYTTTLSFTSLISSNISVSNLFINSEDKSVFNSLLATSIQSSFIGDATGISNLYINKFRGKYKDINGGISSNIYVGNVLYGYDNTVYNSTNITFNNNTFIVNSNIIVNKVYNKYIYANIINNNYIYGDGTNISNININNIIGIYDVKNGGTGNNYLQNMSLLIGDGLNPIKFSSNLYWGNDDSLHVNGTLKLSQIISITDIIASNQNVSNLNVSSDAIFNNIHSSKIQSKYYGDGYGLSNIHINNIINMPRSISSNILTYGNIIIGNNSNTVILSSNLSWYDNKLYSTKINVSNISLLYFNQSNINVNNLYIDNNYIIDKSFYISLNISSGSSIGNYIPFNINNSLSSPNITSYWNNYFMPPINGLYSFDYSICTDTPCIIYIYKNNNKFGNKYIANNGSINIVLDCYINDNVYFGINSISGSGNILVNDVYGNTKASITLLQVYK